MLFQGASEEISGTKRARHFRISAHWSTNLQKLIAKVVTNGKAWSNILITSVSLTSQRVELAVKLSLKDLPPRQLASWKMVGLLLPQNYKYK